MTVRSQRRNSAHPLNRAAERWLPPEWRAEHEMPILTLMRWGLANGLSIAPLAPNHPNQEQVEAMIERLVRRKPAKVIAYLSDPEQMGNGETVLTVTDLEQLTCPLDAATLLLETLCNSMVVTRA